MFSAPTYLVLNRFICYVYGHIRENLVLNLKFQGVNIGQDVNRDRDWGASTSQDRMVQAKYLNLST